MHDRDSDVVPNQAEVRDASGLLGQVANPRRYVHDRYTSPDHANREFLVELHPIPRCPGSDGRLEWINAKAALRVGDHPPAGFEVHPKLADLAGEGSTLRLSAVENGTPEYQSVWVAPGGLEKTRNVVQIVLPIGIDLEDVENDSRWATSKPALTAAPLPPLRARRTTTARPAIPRDSTALRPGSPLPSSTTITSGRWRRTPLTVVPTVSGLS